MINGVSDFGGAINLNNASLELIQSDFYFNRANIKGGAVYLNNSNLTIFDCYFNSNNAKGQYANGGGISSENSIISINKSRFFDNSADEGGAIYSINSSLYITNSLIYNNSANWYGGALVSDSQLTIERSSLSNNIAGYKGGAIHTTFSYLTDNCFLKINRSSIHHNSAEYGSLNRQPYLPDNRMRFHKSHPFQA